jgi:hypothetical protein
MTFLNAAENLFKQHKNIINIKSQKFQNIQHSVRQSNQKPVFIKKEA